MNGQGDFFPLNSLLYKALEPGVSRDDVGAVGECMFSLAEAVRRHFPKVTVPTLQPADIWCCFASLSKSDRANVVTGHFRALRAILQHARQG